MDKLNYERKDDNTVLIDGREYVAKEAEVVKWHKPKYGERYHYISSDGRVLDDIWSCSDTDERRFEYGNVFNTIAQAEAVRDLKRHVMKFPAILDGSWLYALYSDPDGVLKWDLVECVLVLSVVRDPHTIHFSSTEEDRAERLRLIKRCNELGVLQFVI